MVYPVLNFVPLRWLLFVCSHVHHSCHFACLRCLCLSFRLSACALCLAYRVVPCIRPNRTLTLCLNYHMCILLTSSTSWFPAHSGSSCRLCSGLLRRTMVMSWTCVPSLHLGPCYVA
ncbi:hypothetical protein FA95DRAFT_955171 [Auriscalpium vulgare]|uniref:Uncharacterized protein n=1 Tax=Auriscalpium vulgare TaxID=40419 RepID=A0ACB8R7J4_9AGAM|nr:hypothetical protein FA95DRAFT_955171 [Auriscalpium vulgare]